MSATRTQTCGRECHSRARRYCRELEIPFTLDSSAPSRGTPRRAHHNGAGRGTCPSRGSPDGRAQRSALCDAAVTSAEARRSPQASAASDNHLPRHPRPSDSAKRQCQATVASVSAKRRWQASVPSEGAKRQCQAKVPSVSGKRQWQASVPSEGAKR